MTLKAFIRGKEPGSGKVPTTLHGQLIWLVDVDCGIVTQISLLSQIIACCLNFTEAKAEKDKLYQVVLGRVHEEHHSNPPKESTK